jgi:nitrite reductase/ring-hydroxylating ferredoxin subunit
MAAHERLICQRAQLLDGGLATRFSLEFNGRVLSAFAVAFDGDVHAYVNVCPHRGTELDWQAGQVFDDSGLYLVCATHGALFAADTGLCVGGPCQGASLTQIAVDTIGGNVYVRAGRVITSLPPTTSA